MIRAGFLALVSHWLRRPLQLAMLLLGLALATALFSGVQAINAEARASYAAAAATLGQDRLETLAAAEGRVPQATFVALRRAGWLVSPVIEGRAEIGGVPLRLIGIDPLTLPAQAQQVDLGGDGNLLEFLTPPGLLFVSAQTAADLAGRDTPPLRIAPGVPPGTAITDIGRAQVLLAAPDEISRLILDPVQPLGRPALASVAPDLILRAPDPQGDIARLTDSFHLNLTAFGLLSFAVGLFIVYGAIGLAFEQRRATFRTLRALGLSALALTGLLAAELLVLALAAGALGVVMGYLVASALLPGVAATLGGLYGAEVPGTLSLRPAWWLTGIAIAVTGTLAAAAQSLWRVWRLPILAPAQPRAWALASAAALRWQAAAAAVLFVAALAAGLYGRGLVTGFGVLGGVLLGSALLLPVVLSLALRLAARLARGVLAQWFWADTRQQLPGLSLALMALLLALAANVGVGTMVASFRLTFTGWLDQRLASELYVTAGDEPEAARLRDWLTPRVDAVLPIWSVTGDVAGGPAQLYGVADHATYRDNWPLLQAQPDVWDRIAAGTAVLVNEQLFRRERLALGDLLTLPGGWQTEIAGIYSDYGNPQGQVLIGIDALVAHYPDVPRLRYGLRVPPGRVAAVTDALTAEFGLPAENIIDQGAIKRLSLEVFEQTFAVTAALNVLTLGVAGLAMVASLLTLSGMRLTQLAPVWAMGLTRRQLAGLELLRTLVLAGFTLLVALPVGIGLAWVLLAVVNVAAFGWRLPMHLFPDDWLGLAGLALLAAAVAALVPVRRLLRTPPAELVRVFANER